MNANQPFERRLAAWMAEDATAGMPAGGVDTVLSNTSRMRREPRWLALLKEPPMRLNSAVVVGSPTRRVALAAAVALVLIAASFAVGTYLLSRWSTDDWTAFRGGPGREGRALHGPIGQGVVSWRFTTPSSFGRSVAIVGDLAYASSDDGVLHAVDVHSGQESWTFAAPSRSASDVAVADGLVYLSDGGERVYALDAHSGVMRWRSQPVAAASSLAVGGGGVYFGTADGAITALDARAGSVRWRFAVPGATVAIGNAAFANGRVYAAYQQGALLALDASTGRLVWQRPIGQDGAGTAVVAGDVAFIGAGPDDTVGHLRAFDAATGIPLWEVAEAFGAPAVSDGVAYATIQPQGDIAAFDVKTGRQIWRSHLASSLRAPAVAAGVVYITADSEHAVYGLSADGGLELWRMDVDGGSSCCIAVAQGKVFVATDRGSLYAIAGDGKSVVPKPIPSPGASTTASTPEPSTASGSPSPPAVALRWAATAPMAAWAPGAVVRDPSTGHLWVADPYNHRFTLFAADGTYLESWGTHGTGDGQFNLRRANGDGYGTIAFASDGSFFVLDVGNHRIQAFDAKRRFLRAWGGFGGDPGMFLDPVGIVVAPDGSICVLDDRRGVIERYERTGKLLGSFDAFPNASKGENTANSLAIDASGNLYVSDIEPGQVDRFDPRGRLTGTFGEGIFGDQPSSMAIDAAGRLFVDQGPSRGADPAVLVFDPDGAQVGAFGGTGSGPLDLTWPTGMLLIGGDIVVGDVSDPETPEGRARLIRYSLLPPLAP